MSWEPIAYAQREVDSYLIAQVSSRTIRHQYINGRAAASAGTSRSNSDKRRK